MSAVDTPVEADDRGREPEPRRERSTSWRGLDSVPAWIRFPLYLVGGMLLLALARDVSNAGQLTAEATFRSALELALPIALAGLGGLWAERAGVVNIGLEGMMVLGTWFGAYGALQWGPWQGVVLGLVAGALGGLLHAVATVSFGVDHIISGVAINLLAVGLTDYLTTTTSSWAINGKPATKESPTFDNTIVNVDLLPFLEKPLTNLSNQNRFLVSDLAKLVLAFTTDISLLVVVALLLFPLTWYVLWRTPLGLRLRSVGEDPEAADSLGVKVYGMKYLAVITSGAMSGLGGVLLVYLFATQFSSGQTDGRGFIGLAAMIFGNWQVGGLVAGAGLFGFMDAMQAQVDKTAHALLVVAALVFVVLAVWQAVRRRWVRSVALVLLAVGAWLWYQTTDELPVEFIPYFPHITTLLVLVFASQRLRMPAADGKVYRRSGR